MAHLILHKWQHILTLCVCNYIGKIPCQYIFLCLILWLHCSIFLYSAVCLLISFILNPCLYIKQCSEKICWERKKIPLCIRSSSQTIQRKAMRSIQKYLRCAIHWKTGLIRMTNTVTTTKINSSFYHSCVGLDKHLCNLGYLDSF